MYKVILEFYATAHEMLTKRGKKLILTLVVENKRLPVIIQDFLLHADSLRRLIEKATCEIVEDIQAMLYDRQSRLSLFP